ncbi:CidA/LrgA family protein [Massilia norwichensis]|uniref:CidA/LrgA family protein n=1 Tax=Massilia norwichensis TaxID=1442366 RepID=A0ABT2A4R1_9BURK|nr:CidA/LrgA family protein [Massilia norwichensis]MCS0589191.1 CidA/LrgA family protein [Massilia norwichensis]
MLQAFAVLLVFQCLGEGLVFLFGWPVPGPVTGMLLLLAALVAVPRLQDVVESGASELLRHLSLLFVPAGVGIVVAASSGSGQWLAIAASVVASTLVTLAVTALVLQGLMPRKPSAKEEGGHV